MRRRIWWQICLLDIRASEYHGSDYDVAKQYYDAKVPLNINDDNLVPGSVDRPLPHNGITEISLLLIRYEVILSASGISAQLLASAQNAAKNSDAMAQQIDQVTDDIRAKVENQFLKHCNTEIPWHWLIVTVAKMMLARLWVSFHHRLNLGGFDDSRARGYCYREIRERLFMTSIEIVESCLLIDRNESTAQWRWAFRNFVPWQAIAFILSELCSRNQDENSKRAWDSVLSAFAEWTNLARDKRHNLLAIRMQKLFEKAKRLRCEAISGNGTGGQRAPVELVTPPVQRAIKSDIKGLNRSQNQIPRPNPDQFRWDVPDIRIQEGNRDDSQWQYVDLEPLNGTIGNDSGQPNWEVDEMDISLGGDPVESLNAFSFPGLDDWW